MNISPFTAIESPRIAKPSLLIPDSVDRGLREGSALRLALRSLSASYRTSDAIHCLSFQSCQFVPYVLFPMIVSSSMYKKLWTFGTSSCFVHFLPKKAAANLVIGPDGECHISVSFRRSKFSGAPAIPALSPFLAQLATSSHIPP